MLRQLWARLFGGQKSLQDAEVRRAFVDELTALPTRHVMLDRLRSARKAGIQGTLAMCDVDHLKLLNDRHGHKQGDALLRAVAIRLQACLPPNADLARVGGDEFIAFLPGMQAADAERAVRKSLDVIREPISLSGDTVAGITMSVGLATFSGQSIDEALKACDVAMYAAKARGRDRVVVFDDDTRQIVTARRELAATVVELQERNRALRDEARTDALTGLRNRRALDEILDVVPASGHLRLQAVAVAFIDVDHFGDYNHLYGDASGDETLRAIAAAVRGSSRDPDLVFRKGGEELVAVLCNAIGHAASVAAERIRTSVEQLAIAHAGSAVAPMVTVTIGVATGAPRYSVRQLLNAAAEQAMSAKVNNLRNKVHYVHLDAKPVIAESTNANPAQVDRGLFQRLKS